MTVGLVEAMTEVFGTNNEIAHELGISHETIKEHIQHTQRKLHVADRMQAAVWAVRKGIA